MWSLVLRVILTKDFTVSNDSKTEVLHTGLQHTLALTSNTCMTAGSNKVQFNDTIKKLGVHLDPPLLTHQNITHLCKAANSELRKIASVRSLLIQTEGTTVQLASSLILSCLDYCNFVLAGLPFEELLCLQKIQNNAARLVFQKPKQDHVTPLMSELHWLPVKFRVQYKLATLASCCFDGSLPPCPSSLLNIY